MPNYSNESATEVSLGILPKSKDFSTPKGKVSPLRRRLSDTVSPFTPKNLMKPLVPGLGAKRESNFASMHN